MPKKRLENFLTLAEKQTLEKRVQIAKLLAKKLTVREIARRLGVSTTTVVRVNKILKGEEKKERETKETFTPKLERKRKLPWIIG